MSKTVMIDWIALGNEAIANARATGIRYYTAENMAEAALSFIPAEMVAAYEARFGTSLLSALTRRIARDAAAQSTHRSRYVPHREWM